MSEPEVVESVSFKTADYIESPDGGPKITPQFISFLQQALTGKLPDLGEIPEEDPEVLTLAAELAVIHLPEWTNPAGRKLADPTVTSIKQAIRVAKYLVQGRGVRIHPDLETLRWVPTPGGLAGPYDTGLHVTKDEHGNWPTPDPEQFYDVDDVTVSQLDTGEWAAVHPRGIQFTAPSKSEALQGIIERIRQKIEEARDTTRQHDRT